jgi:stage II sporulation protein M
MSFRALFAHFREMKHYFIAAAAVFIAGLVYGFYQSDHFEAIIQEQLKGLENIASSVSQSSQPQVMLFLFIYLNNLIKSIFSIFIGVFFGIFPVFFLVLNGMILGYIGSQSVAADKWILLLKGILPHGILEIPSVIIACAYGIRFGMLMFQGVAAYAGMGSKLGFKKELRKFIRLTIPLIILLAIVLLAAALIESTFTLWLVKK